MRWNRLGPLWTGAVRGRWGRLALKPITLEKVPTFADRRRRSILSLPRHLLGAWRVRRREHDDLLRALSIFIPVIALWWAAIALWLAANR